MKVQLWFLIFIFGVFISSISQVILKISSKKVYKNKIREYANGSVICAYLLFFGATLITVIAYQYIPLSTGLVLEALGYVFVGILSHFTLKEKITRKKIIGIISIILGILIINITI